jgi:hypothetical protein
MLVWFENCSSIFGEFLSDHVSFGSRMVRWFCVVFAVLVAVREANFYGKLRFTREERGF